ncbi:hypothetical protein PRZ48_013128 [Zasmidium cellare]|uniref:Uncharacterized protein n=1 Tax=Zasmidium cellare TaxID=395010 RepID=A0ABR0E371_ZASCE|nr:hypothetical protein PRZ48_013128 [Zasmidium cellare]
MYNRLSSLAFAAAAVAAVPAAANGNLTAYGGEATTTTYACNPAHQYPGGQSCISTNGQLSLVTPAPSASSTYACNPAHSYPNGATCVSESGHLTLVTYSVDVPEYRTASSAATTPLICNAAAIARGDCTATAAIVPSSSAASPSFSAYDCNPAHSYPNGQTCTSINGTRGLVFPPATTTADYTTYTTVTTCPVTQTSGKATVTTLTTSTVVVTSCKGGCPSKDVPHTSIVPTSAAPSPSADCQKKHDDCRSVKNPSNPPNYAQCAAEYAGCLGYNPFTNGPASSTPVQSKPAQPTTVYEHTTVYTTYCPQTTTSVNKGTTVTSVYSTHSTVTSVYKVTTAVPQPPKSTQKVDTPIPQPPQSTQKVNTPIPPPAPQSTSEGCHCPAAPACTNPPVAYITVTQTVYTGMSSKPASTSSSAHNTTASVPNSSFVSHPVSSSTTYACNPAHAYPGGATCISQSGSLTLVTRSVDVPEYRTQSASASTTPMICNAAAIARGDCTATAAIVPTSSSTTYACNPAHQYPGGAQCISTNGQLSLVTPTPTPTGY